MTGLFNTLNTANKGLMAQQTSLHTAGHNIANANTRGYSRQRVELKADMAYKLGGVGQLGTGVKMDSINRIVDEYVVKQIRNETSKLETYTAKSQVIDQLEVIFNEPSDTGLNFYLGEMFDSWQELSKNPESLTSKTIVVEKSRALAETINHMAKQINSLKDETVTQLEKNALDFNSIVEKLAALNDQIYNIASSSQVPNDLLDQRDLMLHDLATIANFRATFDAFGRVSIKTADGQIDLLATGGQEVYELSVITEIEANENGGYSINISRGGRESQVITMDENGIRQLLEIEGQEAIDITPDMVNRLVGKVIFTNKEGEGLDIRLSDSISSGKIQGNTEGLDVIEDSIKELNDFAKMMADAINHVHTYDTAGNPVDNYINIFTYGDDPASSLAINQDLEASKILAGQDYDSPEGDGSRALAIARLRNVKLNPQDELEFGEGLLLKDMTGGVTIEGAYANIVIDIGISKEHADNIIANQKVLVGQLELRRESTSGVSIDEEITNIIKYQKAYEANARVIATLAEMLDVLINRTGV